MVQRRSMKKYEYSVYVSNTMPPYEMLDQQLLASRSGTLLLAPCGRGVRGPLVEVIMTVRRPPLADLD